MASLPGDGPATCAICFQPIATTMLRVIVWSADREELRVPEGATEEEATYVVVHRDCFERVMHPSYNL
jgi:hypothetical protein